MARSPVIHIPTTTSLYEQLEEYKETTGASTMAEVGRELLLFALLIKKRSGEDDSRTNRELLEKILLTQCVNLQVSKQIYIYVWDDTKAISATQVDMMREKIATATAKAQVAFDTFMNKEDE